MKKLGLIILFISIAAFLFADGIKFTASAPNVVATGKRFKITFTLNASGSDFNAPDLSNFNVLMGPSTSSSSSISFVNGQMSKSVKNTYTYILIAQKTGKFEIGSAEIIVKGKKYKSNKVNIEVIKGSNANANNSNNNAGNSNTPKNIKGVSNKDLFVRLHINKSSVYQGEPLIATLKLYSRVNLAGFEDIKFPSYNNFWTQEIKTPNQIQLQRENINGKIYNTGVLSKMVLFPQQSGKITIEPGMVECIIRKRVRGGFFSSYKDFKKTVYTKAVTVKVAPLPSNKPASFKGAVGKFKMNVDLDKNHVKVNDAISLKINISGSGNLKLVDPPEVNFPPDFEVYDPEISNNVNNSVAGSRGNKTIEYLIIPRHAGSFEIEPVEFSYFDLGSNTYKSIKSDNFKIKVDKGDGTPADDAVVANFAKEDVQFLGSDIHFIKQKTKLKPELNIIFTSILYKLAFPVLLLLFFLLIYLGRKQIKKRSDVALMKNKKAKKIARKRFKKAATHLKNNEEKGFYEEVSKALWGYISDKFSIATSEMSKENGINTLKENNIDDNLIADFENIIDTCEFARYAPAGSDKQMQEVYNKAINSVLNIENDLKS